MPVVYIHTSNMEHSPGLYFIFPFSRLRFVFWFFVREPYTLISFRTVVHNRSRDSSSSVRSSNLPAINAYRFSPNPINIVNPNTNKIIIADGPLEIDHLSFICFLVILELVYFCSPCFSIVTQFFQVLVLSFIRILHYLGHVFCSWLMLTYPSTRVPPASCIF